METEYIDYVHEQRKATQMHKTHVMQKETTPRDPPVLPYLNWSSSLRAEVAWRVW